MSTSKKASKLSRSRDLFESFCVAFRRSLSSMPRSVLLRDLNVQSSRPLSNSEPQQSLLASYSDLVALAQREDADESKSVSLRQERGAISQRRPTLSLFHFSDVGGVLESNHNSGGRSCQYGGGKATGGMPLDASKGAPPLMPQQRFVPGQFLKANPLKPRPPPAKWDDAEKWLVSPASARSNTHSQYGNGSLSGGSTPQHILQLHAAASARHHYLPPSANHSSRLYGTSAESSLPANAESYDARLLGENGNVSSANGYGPITHVSRFDSSTKTECVSHEDRILPVVAKHSALLNRSGDQGHPLPDSGSTLVKAKANLLVAVNKLVRETTDRKQAEYLHESMELQEPKKYSSDYAPPVDTSEGTDGRKQVPFTAAIFDQFTKDKFADPLTVQSTSPNNGRLIIVMKDAATEITPSTSQRDIATQVTPVASFHTAVTPPRIHNAGGPARLNTTPVHSERRTTSVGVDVTELQNCHQAKLELDQAAALDTNWTTREEEVEESATSLRLSVSRSVDFKEVKRNVLEARASAWEEAEQSKYMARYHREEAKILAWEAHQKAKAEAAMRKMEVKLERMHSHANELLQNKLASVHLRAENMRAAAASECGEQAAKTNQWAQEIRTNGRSPSPPVLCCFPRFNS